MAVGLISDVPGARLDVVSPFPKGPSTATLRTLGFFRGFCVAIVVAILIVIVVLSAIVVVVVLCCSLLLLLLLLSFFFL